MIHTAETEPSISTIAVVPRRRAIAVRPAMPVDRRAIHALFAALHRFNASLEPGFALAAGWDAHLDAHLEREWAGEHGVTLLAWDGADPIGLAMASEHVDSPLFLHRRWVELTALYVVPLARGGDAADRLMDAVRGWAGRRGAGEIRLFVTASNQRARRFYAAAGFRPLQEIWTTSLDAAGEIGASADAA